MKNYTFNRDLYVLDFCGMIGEFTVRLIEEFEKSWKHFQWDIRMLKEYIMGSEYNLVEIKDLSKYGSI